MAPVVGLRGETSLVVEAEHTAEAVGSGLVPVLATPVVVGLMEEAAVAALRGHLDDGETSVGAEISIRHLAPTPVGSTVRAVAELVAIDGRKLTFQVSAYDDGGLIAEGTHARVIVSVDRFLAKARERQVSKR